VLERTCKVNLAALILAAALVIAFSGGDQAVADVDRVLRPDTGLGANDLSDIAWDGERIWITGSGTLTKRLWGDGRKSSDWFSYRAMQGFGSGSMSALFASPDVLILSWVYTDVRDDNPVTTGDGFSISYDRGETWNHIPITELFPDRAGFAYPGAYTTCYDIDFSDGTLWAATTSGFLLKSDDLGATWDNIIPGDEPLNLLNPNHHGQCVAAYGDTVWVGTFQGMNVSVDRGATWTNHSWPTDGSGGSGDPKPGNFCVAVERKVVGGATHIWVGSQPYYGIGVYGICHSPDNGLTWEYASTNYTAWNFAFGYEGASDPAVSDSTVFAASDSGLVVSYDLGASWETMAIRESDTLAWESGTRVFGVIAENDTLWVTSSDGLAMSPDWGDSWNIYKGVTRVRAMDNGDRNIGISSYLDDVETYAFPNPFSPSRQDKDYARTRIQYALAENADVSITIHDYTGRTIRELISDEFRGGGRDYQEVWDGRDGDNVIVPNGVYFYIIKTNRGDTARGKIVVLD